MIGSPELAQYWPWIGNASLAHAIALREAGIIGDESLGGIARAIDSTRLGTPPEAESIAELIAEFDERVDAQLPAGFTGAAAIGRGTIDLGTAVVRCEQRDQLLQLAVSTRSLRTALLDFADLHVTTLMPAYVDGAIAQPTTLGHLSGGLIGPLARAAHELDLAYATVNRSPMGAGALASSGIATDRERIAELLGFDEPIENTFDAVSAVDHFAAIADAVVATIAPVRRWCTFLLEWMRVEPGSFILTDEWLTTISSLPHGRFPSGLAAFIATARRIEASAIAVRIGAAEHSYGPVAGALNELAAGTYVLLADACVWLERATSLVRHGLSVNRALLANRAGKGLATSGDLADFLMIEEQIEPGAARNIAALTMSRARDLGLEAAGITPELIDGAALLVIGREIKAEFEAISRYLAPRRFIERRTATGAPSPAATRDYLAGERARLATDERWLAQARERLRRAADELSRLEHEALAAIAG